MTHNRITTSLYVTKRNSIWVTITINCYLTLCDRCFNRQFKDEMTLFFDYRPQIATDNGVFHAEFGDVDYFCFGVLDTYTHYLLNTDFLL